MLTYLDFEKPIAELETRVAELRETAENGSIDIDAEVDKLEAKAARLLRDTYAKLTPWQKAQVARHPDRPHFKDYLGGIADDFVSLAGDRAFADDPAVVGGLARIDGRPVMLIGHEKGDDTASRLKHNFGMAKPEGYRKAIRLMKLADQFGIPVVTLVDTSGAFPGVQAEERGQAEAIAKALQVMASLECPMISVVIGEGGSGGALALGVTDRILMLEYSIYSVISPEGCASILWRDPAKIAEAATQLKLTAPDLVQLGICDAIIPEAAGGAHRNPAVTAARLRSALKAQLQELVQMPTAELIEKRYQKFRKMGAFIEQSA
jgi:acetyl-CoA carboxylase carboxyl transferase subunit alpha